MLERFKTNISEKTKPWRINSLARDFLSELAEAQKRNSARALILQSFEKRSSEKGLNTGEVISRVVDIHRGERLNIPADIALLGLKLQVKLKTEGRVNDFFKVVHEFENEHRGEMTALEWRTVLAVNTVLEYPLLRFNNKT